MVVVVVTLLEVTVEGAVCVVTDEVTSSSRVEGLFRGEGTIVVADAKF